MRLIPFARLAPLLLSFVAIACPAGDDGETQAETNEDTSGPTTDADDSSSGVDSSGGADDSSLGCAFPEEIDGTNGASNPLQETWGAACSTDADCVALIGEGGVCLTAAVIFEMPGGYCSKPCMLPDTDTRVVMDDPMCDAAGGVACVGAMGTFEYCQPLCTDDAQCERDGYICRQMPIISFPEDPSLCLMPDCCGEPASAPTCAND